jgi:ABC-2 type transport system ATP-binding protein
MLLGLTQPISGTVSINGFNPTRDPLKVKRIVGYMPEKTGFYSNLTARENLDLTCQFNGISKKEADSAIDDVLRTIGIHEYADIEVSKYSKGMKQRLGIGDILIKKPKVAIFDEPTTSLDPMAINQVLDIIATLPDAGTTVIMSSHRLYEVQRVCNRAAILYRGGLVVEGGIQELSQRSMTEYRYQIEVEIFESADRLIPVISEVEGVLNVESRDSRLRIFADRDLRSDISRIIIQNEISLVEIKIRESDLSDIYSKYFPTGYSDR